MKQRARFLKRLKQSEMKEKELQWTPQRYKGLYENIMKGYTPPSFIT